jgi:hypothetical protein
MQFTYSWDGWRPSRGRQYWEREARGSRKVAAQGNRVNSRGKNLVSQMPMGRTTARAAICGQLYSWSHAVGLQRDRVLCATSNIDRQADVELLVLAVRNVLRAVDWVVIESDQMRRGEQSMRLRAARDKFKAAIPNAVEVGDILDHFDDYEREGQASDSGAEQVLHVVGYDCNRPCRRTLRARRCHRRRCLAAAGRRRPGDTEFLRPPTLVGRVWRIEDRRDLNDDER